ncbi:MAG: MMPL family transporter [Nocardioidaceae bacterium]
MSSFLYRFGHRVVRHGRRVLAVWALLLVVLGALAAGLGGQLQDNLTIPGTESQQGLDALAQRFPQVAGTSGQILFVAPPGQPIRRYDGQVRQVLRAVRGLDHVEVVTDPFTAANRGLSVARHGRDALAQVQLDVPLDRLDPATVAALRRTAVVRPGSPVAVHLGGPMFTNHSVHVSGTEGIGVLAALAVLALTFGSLLAAGMPIVTAVLGVGVAMAGVLAVAAFTDVNTSTPTLALMIGLAVGIDYALFIVSRHRGQLARGAAVAESVAQALATAGGAVIFAGATVVIALCGLVVARIPFLAVMGYAAAVAVAVAVAVALTVVPALLGLAGERLRPRPGSRAARNAVVEPGQTHTLGARWVAVATRLPALTVVLVVGVLLVLALPARHLTLGLPDNGSAEPGSTQRTTYDLVSRDYGPGFNTPLLVTADIIRTRHPVAVMHRLGRDLGRLDGVRAVALATPNRSADLGIVQVVPARSQTDPATAALVREIRADRSRLEHRYDITHLRVTGQTAVTIDVSDRLSAALVPFGIVVVGLSLVLLTVVFRSVAVPLKATLGYLLSVGAALGAVAAVFEHGVLAGALNVAKVGPVISFLPILLMGVLFGLAMDYEVFLVSRMREEYVRTGDARRAVTAGFTASARVVTAAAVIMISVFAAFVPQGDSTIQPIALGLAVGVFVDAFLVRMTLVPAVLALLGRRAWWLPARLDRRLPHLDVEGAGLARHLEHQEWTARHGAAVLRAEEVRLDGVFEHVNLLLRRGALLAVVSDDRVARRALLSSVSGRLDVAGRLVVLDRLLPAEGAAVRRRVPLFERFPTREELARLPPAGPDPTLVVVDDVDLFASADEVENRWSALLDLTARGVTVVAGCQGRAPRDAGVLDLRALGTATEAKEAVL